jgi:hypothetical protein
MTVTVLGTRARPKPADKLPLDRLFVGAGVSSPEVLPHQFHAGVEQVERDPERSGRIRRDGHAGIATPPVPAARRVALTNRPFEGTDLTALATM